MESPGSLEAIQVRHRKEQKELQGRITQKKKNATKKTRKGVNDECEKLEQELKDRQQQELAALHGDNAAGKDLEDQTNHDEEPPETNGSVNETADKLENTSISPEPKPPIQNGNGGGGQKRNRQKDRLARRAAEVEAESLAAAKEASSLPNWKRLERTSMLTAFSTNNLQEVEIQPDGHCLFNALADQLESNGIYLQRTSSTVSGGKTEPKYKILRRMATEYMEANKEDFEAFVDEDFEGYLRKIRDTAEWGGQLELLAVARRFGVEIRVIQDERIEKIEPGVEGETKKDAKTLWLAYYRHGYGLGEHYNSLRKKEAKP